MNYFLTPTFARNFSLLAAFFFLEMSSSLADDNFENQLDAVSRISVSKAVETNLNMIEAIKHLDYLDKVFGRTSQQGGTGRYFVTYQKLVDCLVAIDLLARSNEYDLTRLNKLRSKITGILEKVGDKARHLIAEKDATLDVQERQRANFRASMQNRLDARDSLSSYTLTAVIVGFGFLRVRVETIEKVKEIFSRSGNQALRANIKRTFKRWIENGSATEETLSLHYKPVLAKQKSANKGSEEKESGVAGVSLTQIPLSGSETFFDSEAPLVSRLNAGTLLMRQSPARLYHLQKEQINNYQIALLKLISDNSAPLEVRQTASMLLLHGFVYRSFDSGKDEDLIQAIVVASRQKFTDPILNAAIEIYLNSLEKEVSERGQIDLREFDEVCGTHFKTKKRKT